MRGTLYRKTKRDNIPFIVYQICNLDWDVEDGVPYDRINFYFTVRRDPAFGDFTTIGHSERSRTRSASKYEAESHCRKISTSSGWPVGETVAVYCLLKLRYLTARRDVAPYEGLIYTYQDLWDDGVRNFKENLVVVPLFPFPLPLILHSAFCTLHSFPCRSAVGFHLFHHGISPHIYPLS